MVNVGDKVLVFREKSCDVYHRRGEYVQGIVLKKHPRFMLVCVKGKYKECFFNEEVYKYDKDLESAKERIDRCNK